MQIGGCIIHYGRFKMLSIWSVGRLQWLSEDSKVHL